MDPYGPIQVALRIICLTSKMVTSFVVVMTRILRLTAMGPHTTPDAQKSRAKELRATGFQALLQKALSVMNYYSSASFMVTNTYMLCRRP